MVRKVEKCLRNKMNRGAVGPGRCRKCRCVAWVSVTVLAALLAACESNERGKQVTSTTVMGAGLGVFGGPIGVVVGAGLGAAAGAVLPEGMLEQSEAGQPSR
jgi:hypothetical protein